jgi:hypothetical protein
MQFDVVTKLAPGEHLGGEHADAVSTGSFGGQQRFIGPPQQVQA